MAESTVKELFIITTQKTKKYSDCWCKYLWTSDWYSEVDCVTRALEGTSERWSRFGVVVCLSLTVRKCKFQLSNFEM